MKQQSQADKVREFQEACGQSVGLPFNNNTLDQIVLCEDLIEEEYSEVIDASCVVYDAAIDDGRPSAAEKAALLKELVDLLYVVYFYANTFGLPIDEAFNRVHASNMSKLVDGKAIKREDGKVLKGPNYVPPTLTDLVQ